MEDVALILLTDAPAWVAPLRDALEGHGAAVAGVDVRETDALPTARMVVNRVSAGAAEAVAQKTLTLLGQAETAGTRVINGARCHRVGASKLAQATLFAHVHAPTPRTERVTRNGSGAGQWTDRSRLLKPDKGTFGRGIVRLAPGQRPSAQDLKGVTLGGKEDAVIQEVVEARDGCVHRVEILGNRPLYEAVVPLVDDETNYCLAAATDREEAGGPPLRITTAISPAVATLVPAGADGLPFAPLARVADWLMRQLSTID